MTTLHPHAVERSRERGATADEILATVAEGEQFEAKYGRTGFRHEFAFDEFWRGKRYAHKQIEAFAVWENEEWLVISVLVKYY